MIKKSDFNFKKAFEELEKINEWFSQENVDLDEGLKKFRHGMELIREAKDHLKQVENEFHEIKKEYRSPEPESSQEDKNDT